MGTIGIVDFDTVEIHNLHRQILYSTSYIGKKKATVAAEKLKALNPNCSFIVFDELLSEENAAAMIEQYDVVLDGSDNFLTDATKTILTDLTGSHAIPCLWQNRS